jgi:ribosomal protein S18 acetylase RimI-like enzyme
MTNPITIRPYRSADRPAVRHIACETADRGQPVENLYSDRELIADLVTRYSTDFEPETSWVAEADGTVIGYLTAAVNSHRHHRIMVWRVAPPAIGRALLHGALGRRETWRMLAVLRRNLRKYAQRRHVSLDGYPAHLHINLLPGFRGQQIGERLMQVFGARMEARQIPGVQAAVRADNPAGCAFFERMGFRPVADYEAILPTRGGVQNVRTLLYGRSRSASPSADLPRGRHA